GGEAVLFTISPTTSTGVRVNDAWDRAQLVVQRLETGERRTVISNAADARYLPTGHLVYASSGVVFAVQFDLKHLTVMGPPMPVVEGVRRSDATGAAHFSVSDTGTLVYLAGPMKAWSGQEALALSDRQGS